MISAKSFGIFVIGISLFLSGASAKNIEDVSVNTEGGVCLTCESGMLSLPDPVPVAKIEPSTKDCESEALLFKPKYKTFLDLIKIKTATDDTSEKIVQSGLSCLYGFGKGAVLSVRDVIMLFPTLVNLAFKGGKWTYNTIKNAVTDPNWFKDVTQKVGDTTSSAFKSLKEFATSSWSKSSDRTKEALATSGIGGAAAAIAVEMYESSPHHVIKDTLYSASKSVANFIKKEWTAFSCMTPQAQSEVLCMVMGYLTLDVVTGKVIWGNLAKSPKILEAIQSAKEKMMAAPVIGKAVTKFVMKDFTPISAETIASLKDAEWVTDGTIRIANKTVEVLEKNGNIYARTIDPSTKSIAVFTVAGKTASEIQARIASSRYLELQVKEYGQSSFGQVDFFSPGNGKIARTVPDYVRTANAELGVDISDYTIKKVSGVIRTSPELSQQYGDVMRAVNKSLEDLEKAGSKLSKTDKEYQKSLHGLMGEINNSIAKSEAGETINLANIEKIISEAATTGERGPVEIYRQALASLNESGGPGKFDAFMANATYGLAINKEMQARVKNCLIGRATK